MGVTLNTSILTMYLTCIISYYSDDMNTSTIYKKTLMTGTTYLYQFNLTIHTIYVLIPIPL